MNHASDSNQRGAYRQPLDVHAEAEAFGERFDAIVVDVSELGCRFRSSRRFELDVEVSLRFSLEGSPPFALGGRITSRKVKEDTFTYGLEFIGVPGSTREALLARIRDVERHAARARAELKYDHAPVGREAFRVPIDIPLGIERSDGTSAVAKAIDVSATGLRIETDEPLVEGADLYAVFRLPNVRGSVVRGTPKYVITPFGSRARGSKSAPPFGRMRAQMNVVAELPQTGTGRTYALSFGASEAFVRDEVARFVQYAQLGNVTKSDPEVLEQL